MIIVLVAAFLLTAVLYASVGFGGGSTYSALLALSGLDFYLIPIVSLLCNIAVVSGGSVRFARAGLTPWRGAVGLTVLGAPAALLGGLTPVGEGAFFLVLGGSLLVAGMAILLPNGAAERQHAPAAQWIWLAAAPIGYISGLVGIGGGIFLAPLLHLVHWRTERQIAATASLFILVNSLFGLAGQLLKNGATVIVDAVLIGLPLIIAVVIGGQIGSLMAVRILPKRVIRWLTAILTIGVGVRLLAAL